MDEFSQTPETLELGLRDIDVNSFIMDEGTLVNNKNPHKLRVGSFQLGPTRVIQGLQYTTIFGAETARTRYVYASALFYLRSHLRKWMSFPVP
jgi:hypothetical protein